MTWLQFRGALLSACAHAAFLTCSYLLCKSPFRKDLRGTDYMWQAGRFAQDGIWKHNNNKKSCTSSPAVGKQVVSEQTRQWKHRGMNQIIPAWPHRLHTRSRPQKWGWGELLFRLRGAEFLANAVQPGVKGLLKGWSRKNPFLWFG